MWRPELIALHKTERHIGMFSEQQTTCAGLYAQAIAAEANTRKPNSISS